MENRHMIDIANSKAMPTVNNNYSCHNIMTKSLGGGHTHTRRHHI